MDTTEREKALALALQRVLFRGRNWLHDHRCGDGDACPNRQIAVKLVEIAEKALGETDMTRVVVGRVGIPPLEGGPSPTSPV